MLSDDAKFVNLLAPRLQKFKRKDQYLWNCRCPFCEQGTPGKKARGYIYEREGRLLFFCHKCGESMSVSRLIKRLDTSLYSEYIRDKLTMKREGLAPLSVASFPEPRKFSADGVVPYSTLPASHLAVRYVESRQIPPRWRERLLYAQDFYAWANKMVPGKYAGLRAEPRLVIPFIGADGTPTGFQGRSLDRRSSLKYVSIELHPGRPFLFALDRVAPESVVFALEGPIDAMFLPNAVATGGGDVSREILRSPLDPERVVVVYDCERRSPATIKKMVAAVERGLSVCVWPDSIHQKDVNDMVLAGTSPDTVAQLISQCAKRGPLALAAIAAWRRC